MTRISCVAAEWCRLRRYRCLIVEVTEEGWRRREEEEEEEEGLQGGLLEMWCRALRRG